MIHNNRTSHRKCKGEKFFAPTSTIGKILLIGAIGVQTIISCSSDGGGSEENPSSSSIAVTTSSSSVGITPSSSSVVVMECPLAFIDGSFCDERDGQIYNYVTIGTGTTAQIWMAKNLNYNASGSVCYNNDPSNCDTYGRLYDWETAVTVCPNGWHLPSYDEWAALITAVGGSSTAGSHLKAKNGWNDCGPSGSDNSYLCEDTYGFSALPGGFHYNGSILNAGITGYWWSATEYDASSAYIRGMFNHYSSVVGINLDKSNLFSVRCVKD